MKKYTAKIWSGTPIVVTAKNKKEALEKIRAYKPETKLADIMRHN